MKFLFAAWLALTMAFAVSPMAQAQSVGELQVDADYCTILRAFTNSTDPRCAPLALGTTRAVTSSPEAVPVDVAQQEKGYFIYFGFNSTAIEGSYLAHLSRLAQVLKSESVADHCVKLVGHTDSVGSDGYNADLSKRRAASVEKTLVASLGIAADRLIAQGMGEKAMLPGLPGTHPKNRRVEFLARPRGPDGCK